MAKPNENFKLSVEDIKIIEIALRDKMHVSKQSEKIEINGLLGKLHNQKSWYRPSKKVYVSG